MFKNLSHFIQLLDESGELLRVKEYVDPELEIAEVVDRISKQPGGGKALLFENNGTEYPLLINAFGSLKRMCLALGVNDLDEISKEIEHLFKDLTKPKNSLFAKVKSLPDLNKIASWLPVVSQGRGSCQEIVDLNPDLSRLPILKCWPKDGGRFITLPMVNTRDPHTGVRNVGMYRMQVFSSNETGMHWHKHKVGARHFEEYRKLGKMMPVAVALGGDPVYTYAATAPLPDNIDEYILAGFIRKKKVKLVKGITVDIEIPDDVDFVIEGFVDPNEELIWEGPFGDHTGFYSLADWYPKFHVTCITHRKNAIYPATIVGVPPMEDAYMAKATERIFLFPIKLSLLPELEDMNLPIEGVAHNIAIVKINSSFTGQSYKVMNALWGAGQMMFNKILISVDGEVDIHNPIELGKTLSERVNIATDIFFGKGPMDVLDHSSDVPCFGSKLFIDATSKPDANKTYLQSRVYEEDIAEDLANLPLDSFSFNASLVNHDIPLIIISIDKKFVPNVKEFSHKLYRLNSFKSIKAVIFVDSELDIKDISLVFWYFSGNFEPQRDTYFINNLENELKFIAFDGTRKTHLHDQPRREWPNVVTMDEATIKLVDTKWEKLGIGKLLVSPSLRLLGLVKGDGPVAK